MGDLPCGRSPKGFCIDSCIGKETVMYLWVAIHTDGQMRELRERAEAAGAVFSLPLHISLKISFPVEESRVPDAMAAIRAYYATLAPFSVEVQGIEQNGGIVWLRMKENDTLQRIHRELDRRMEENFGVLPHPYDGDYRFHTTLFIGDEQRAAEIYEELRSASVPSVIRVSRLLIGGSESGRAEDYSVLETYSL